MSIEQDYCGEKLVLVHKYLKISDFVEYILDNQELFLGSSLEGVKTYDHQRKIKMQYVKDFLLQT